MIGAAPPLGWRRTIAFASGDFAFNLYWQSISLYLLFYYTDAVGLPASTAGLIYMIASIWDGLIDPAIGIAADRTRSRWGSYRPWLLFGTVPLALAFALLYYRPPLAGTALAAAILATHLLFRSLYAAVNVPYAALTARITRSAADRANIAGARMVFSTCASVIVALATQRIARIVTGSPDGAAGFFVAACCFAVLATPLLFGVFRTTREDPIVARSEPALPASPRYWRGMLTNRAFWTLVIAGTLMIACYTAFAKSVLYYFKYVLLDEAGAPTALAIAGASGLVIVPGWMLVARHMSKRGIWLVSTAIFAAGLIAFAIFRFGAAWQMNLFLAYMQIGFLGMVYAYWAMLPDTVEYGEWRSGHRSEGLVFGLALLFQKLALGVGAGLFGLALDRIGYRPNQVQSTTTLDGLKTIMVVLPLLGVAGSAAVMLINPLRRGTHEAIVADLAARRTQGELHR